MVVGTRAGKNSLCLLAKKRRILLTPASLTELANQKTQHYLADLWACPIAETVVGEPDNSEGERTLTVSPQSSLTG